MGTKMDSWGKHKKHHYKQGYFWVGYSNGSYRGSVKIDRSAQNSRNFRNATHCCGSAWGTHIPIY